MSNYTKGTLRPHKNAPLRRPTNLDPLYPDPCGHWQGIEDPTDIKRRWIGRVLGAACIVVLVVVFVYRFL